jgi:hypothetical protein
MAKSQDNERQYRDFCRAHDAIVRAVDRLKREGLEDEWTILQALIAHATELAGTRHGPKGGRAFLRKLLYPAHLEVCADCGVVTVERGYGVKDGIWERVWAGRRRLNPEFLCIPCLENRMGRRIRSRDFQPSGLKGISRRELDRMIAPQRALARLQRLRVERYPNPADAG